MRRVALGYHLPGWTELDLVGTRLAAPDGVGMGFKQADDFCRVALGQQPQTARIWRILTERAADKDAEPVMVAGKLMRWAWPLTPVHPLWLAVAVAGKQVAPLYLWRSTTRHCITRRLMMLFPELGGA